jgi:hypothetical protein
MEQPLRSWQSLGWSRSVPHLMESECSFPCLQAPAIGPCPEPVESTTHILTIFFIVNLGIGWRLSSVSRRSADLISNTYRYDVAFQFTDQSDVCTSHIISSPLMFDQPSVGCIVRVMDLSVRLFSVSCYRCLRPEHSSQHLVFKFPQSHWKAKLDVCCAMTTFCC